MVKVSYQQKPYRRVMMQTYGAQVFASPTDQTNYGRSVLANDPDNPGSLGIAISEAVEAAASSGGTKKYSLGSVLNHVLTHQSVIGEEAIKQMDLANEYPDVVIACIGGGSNFAGIAFPFLRENLKNGRRTRLLAVEPLAAPSLTKGVYTFDYGDTARMAPGRKDAHARSQFCAALHSRRRTPLPRHGAQCVRALRRGPDRSRRGKTDCDVRGGGPIRQSRGNRAGARVSPRHPGGHR